MNAYRAVTELVRDTKPEHVLEIGTKLGKRAAEFMAVSNCYYTGFDLFEEAGGRNFEMIDVGKQLVMQGFSKFMLVRGNTKETLPKVRDVLPFDFAFIDGGEEEFEHDLEWVKKNITPDGTIVSIAEGQLRITNGH